MAKPSKYWKPKITNVHIRFNLKWESDSGGHKKGYLNEFILPIDVLVHTLQKTIVRVIKNHALTELYPKD